MNSLLHELKASSRINREKLPFISILIPAFNCSQSLALTLDSIISQDYPRYEIILIDAGSTDRTIETAHSYQAPIRFFSAQEYDIYHMINMGIVESKGDYVNILFPGDFYIHREALQLVMDLACTHVYPDLVYCGTLLRDLRTEVKFLFRNLDLALLKRGQQPTSLQACWFKKEVFQKIGFFQTQFQQRGGYELFCRFSLDPSLRYASLRRALVDYDLRWVTSSMVIRHFSETGQILYAYFGCWDFFQWLIRQKDVKRFFLLWVKHLRLAFHEKK